MASNQAKTVLQKVFGYDKFRPFLFFNPYASRAIYDAFATGHRVDPYQGAAPQTICNTCFPQPL